MQRLFSLILTLGLFGLAVWPSFAQDAPALNLVADCVADYDPETDYFPDKAEIAYADELEIEYHNHYKVVRTLTPYPGAASPIEYILVQCGTPIPEDVSDDALVIEVPIQSAVMLSTTQLPHLVMLDVLESLVAVDSGFYISTSEIQALVADGAVMEVGSGSSINLELVLDLDPQAVFSYGFNPSTDAHPVLIDAGIFTALNAEWLETSPLGRAEWLKFTAAFYNQEAEANAIFAEIEGEYQDLIALTAGLSTDDKPLVLPNAFSPWDEAWNIPGSESYVAQLVRDAGGRMVLGDAPEVQGQTGSVQFDFEVVYEAGLDADVWIAGVFGVSDLAGLLALDERYADFAPVTNGQIYNNHGRVNENGGNDFYESGVTNPHLILADLVAILYPDLLPDHELVYYRPLE